MAGCTLRFCWTFDVICPELEWSIYSTSINNSKSTGAPQKNHLPTPILLVSKEGTGSYLDWFSSLLISIHLGITNAFPPKKNNSTVKKLVSEKKKNIYIYIYISNDFISNLTKKPSTSSPSHPLHRRVAMLTLHCCVTARIFGARQGTILGIHLMYSCLADEHKNEHPNLFEGNSLTYACCNRTV